MGFVLVDKPPGPTSHDVVDAVRRALATRRVGHAGTLDPPASGLVVVGVGGATRLLQYVQRLPKTYETTGVLGVRTSTLDATGEVLGESPVETSEAELRQALGALVGKIMQVPPAVSAVKVGGERAYRRAARGETVELAAREVTVHEIELLRLEGPRFSMRVTCSSGTYVRSLVADVGEALGCGAHVGSLRRTAVGSLHVDEASPMTDVGPQAVRGVQDVLLHLPVVRADEGTAQRARFGQRLAIDAPTGEVLLVGPEGAVGVFESKDGILRPITVLGS